MDVHGPLDIGLHFRRRQQLFPFCRWGIGLLTKQDLRIDCSTIYFVRLLHADQWFPLGSETREVPPYSVAVGHYGPGERYCSFDFEHCCTL